MAKSPETFRQFTLPALSGKIPSDKPRKRVYFELLLRPHVIDPLSSDGVARFGRRAHKKADKSLFDRLLRLERRSGTQFSSGNGGKWPRQILFRVLSLKTSNAEY